MENPPKRPVVAPLSSHDQDETIPSVPSPNHVLSPHYNASPETAFNAIAAPGSSQTHDITANTAAHAEDLERSLGLHPTKFAELYGLGSDMEPILMVGTSRTVTPAAV